MDSSLRFGMTFFFITYFLTTTKNLTFQEAAKLLALANILQLQSVFVPLTLS